MTTVVRRIVLVGAARSGTKILRDVLAAASGAGRVPYDVPFVWYQGARYPDSDVLEVSRLTPRAAKRIRSYVDSYAEGAPPAVIEKTVGNTLRVPFVRSALPDAVLVHLVRDGTDVVESTLRQWQEPSDVGYLRDKVRHVPVRTLPAYGVRYVRSARARRSVGAVASWGVRYPGMQQDLADVGLLRVCARQWRHSVESASAGLREVGGPQVEVRYEDLIAAPAQVLDRVISACGLQRDTAAIEAAAARVRPDTRGRGHRGLDEDERLAVQEEIGTALAALGYPPASPEEELGRNGH